MAEYVVLDFETANPKRVSACSVGGCVISDDAIVDQFSTLIKPPPDVGDFAPMNVRIHGITPEMVAGAPTFGELLPRFTARVQGRTVLAYSKFDRSVIDNLLDYYGSYCEYRYVDVCELAKAKIAGLKNYKLPTVAKHLGIEPFKHHDAVEDALACARIFLALSGSQADSPQAEERTAAEAFSDFIDSILEDGVVDYKEAVELRGFLEVLPQCQVVGELLTAVDEFLDDGVIDGSESQWLVESLRLVQSAMKDTSPDSVSQSNQELPGGPLQGLRVVIDGALARFDYKATKRLIKTKGGIYQENVTKQTGVLVRCDSRLHYDPPGYKSSRVRLAERYISQGCPIRILSEAEFYRRIEEGGASV